MKMAKSRGERLSPCLTPILQVNDFDSSLFSLTHAFVFWYKLKISFMTFPLMSQASSLAHRHDLSTRSKALSIDDEFSNLNELLIR